MADEKDKNTNLNAMKDAEMREAQKKSQFDPFGPLESKKIMDDPKYEPPEAKSKSAAITDQNKSSVAVADDPSDPYQNFQEGKAEKVYVKERNYAEEERAMRANMLAKENEIKAPGSLTQEEAEKLAAGLPPEKQKEVFAQVRTDEKVKDMDYVEGKSLELSTLVTNLYNDAKIGRNEKRERLRTLRQMIQSLETRMDDGRA